MNYDSLNSHTFTYNQWHSKWLPRSNTPILIISLTLWSLWGKLDRPTEHVVNPPTWLMVLQASCWYFKWLTAQQCKWPPICGGDSAGSNSQPFSAGQWSVSSTGRPGKHSHSLREDDWPHAMTFFWSFVWRGVVVCDVGERMALWTHCTHSFGLTVLWTSSSLHKETLIHSGQDLAGWVRWLMILYNRLVWLKTENVTLFSMPKYEALPRSPQVWGTSQELRQHSLPVYMRPCVLFICKLSKAVNHMDS